MSRVCYEVLTRTARLEWVLCLLLALGLSSLAGAEPPQQAQALDRIRATMDEGQAAYLRGEYLDAAAIFEKGYSAHPYSAFLFNAGVCYQKAERPRQALAAFQTYLDRDPKAPDAAAVKERITGLEETLAVGADSAGVEAASRPPSAEEQGEMKSLVVVETDPPGAPLRVFRKVQKEAGVFDASTDEHPGYELVSELVTPGELSLEVGSYHLVVDEFRAFNRSETDIEVSPGHVHHFKANLSQGAFLGFLKVSSNVAGAAIYLDDDGGKRLAWGTTPHGELVSPGPHVVLVEAPGFEPSTVKVDLVAGDNKDLEVSLQRLSVGVVRLDATNEEVSVYEGTHFLGTWKKGEAALEMEFQAGVHQLTVRSKGYKDLTTSVDVPEGLILPVRAAMVKKYPRGVAWSQAVIGAAVLGTSIYFGVESDRLARELASDRTAGRLTSTDPRIDQGYWYSIGANGGFVVGGTLGLLSLYNFLKDPYPDSELKRGKKVEFDRQLGSPPTGVSAAAGGAP